MQAHKSRKVRAFTGVNLFFCFVSQSSVNFLLIRVIQFIVFLIQLFEGWYDLLNHLAHHLFFNLYYTYRTFGRFMTDLYCRFWILVWQTAFIDISSLQFTCGREKLFLECHFSRFRVFPVIRRWTNSCRERLSKVLINSTEPLLINSGADAAILLMLIFFT